MRILDEEANKNLDCISIFLTREEAEHLLSHLKDLLQKPSFHHVHLSSDDYQKEITVCVYAEDNLNSFHWRARKLILEDE